MLYGRSSLIEALAQNSHALQSDVLKLILFRISINRFDLFHFAKTVLEIAILSKHF